MVTNKVFFLILVVHSTTLKTEDGEVLLDYSKNRINQDVMKMLLALVSPDRDWTRTLDPTNWTRTLDLTNWTRTLDPTDEIRLSSSFTKTRPSPRPSCAGPK